MRFKKALKVAFGMYVVFLIAKLVVDVDPYIAFPTSILAGVLYALYDKHREKILIKLASDVDTNLLKKEQDFFCALMDIYEVKGTNLESEEAKQCLSRIKEYAQDIPRISREREVIAKVAEFVGGTEKYFSNNEKAEEFYRAGSLHKFIQEAIWSEKSEIYISIITKCKVNNKSKAVLLGVFLDWGKNPVEYEVVNEYVKYYDVVLNTYFDATDRGSNDTGSLLRLSMDIDEKHIREVAPFTLYVAKNIDSYLKSYEVAPSEKSKIILDIGLSYDQFNFYNLVDKEAGKRKADINKYLNKPFDAFLVDLFVNGRSKVCAELSIIALTQGCDREIFDWVQEWDNIKNYVVPVLLAPIDQIIEECKEEEARALAKAQARAAEEAGIRAQARAEEREAARSVATFSAGAATGAALSRSSTSSSTSKPSSSYSAKPPEAKSSTPTSTSKAPAPKGTVTVISGAVIHKDDGKSMVMYKEKCESCGHVSPSTKNTNFTSAQTTNSVFSHSFVCTKCKKRQEVKIKH